MEQNQADKTVSNDWDECGQIHKENLRGAVWHVIDSVPKTDFCARELTSTISYQKVKPYQTTREGYMGLLFILKGAWLKG